MKKFAIQRKYGLFLLLTVLIGTILRFYNLGENSLWKDEIFSLIRSSQQLSSILFEELPFGTRSPLHHIFIHFALFFGKSEFIVRLQSVLLGIFSIVLIYNLGKLLFNDQKVGLVAAFLMTLSPLHLEYSREARYYSYVVFLSLLSISFFYKMISEKKWRWFIIFPLVTIANLATHATALLILIPQLAFLIFLGVQLLLKGWKGGHFKINFGKLSLRGNFIWKLILIVPFVVVAAVLVKSSNQLFQGIKLNPALPFSEFPIYILEKLSGSIPLTVFYLVFFALGLVITFRKRKKEFSLLLLILIIPPSILYLIRPEGFDFHIRYVIFIIIPYLLLASWGIVALSKHRNLFFLVVFSLVFLSIQPIQAYYQTRKGDWRGVARYLTQNAKSGDVVVTENYYNKILLDYYLEAQKRDFVLITAAETLVSPKVPFRIYFFQTDYALGANANPDGLSLIDYEEMVPFDPQADISPMFLFVSQPIWFWQEAEKDFLKNTDWQLADYWGQKAMGNNALEKPNAAITYKVNIPETDSYNLYANLRWDGARGLLKYKFDNGKFSEGLHPFYGIKGDVASKWRFKEVKLGTFYLTAGEHSITFLNQLLSDETYHYQDIDYFYLTKD